MGDLEKLLIAKYFPESKDSLVIGGVPVSEIVGTHGSPLFIYDRSVLDQKFESLRSSLPEQFSIYYSIKANPSFPILKYFLSRACGLEIASAGEFNSALAAGCPPERILFAGPGKSETELELVLSKGIGEIHVESLTEAKRVASIAHRLQIKANVALRINPASAAEGGAMRMGGRPAPFGLDEELLDETLNVLLGYPELDLTGIHLFAGTQILDATTLLKQYEHGLALGRKVSDRLGKPLRTLDFGGGLGIPYFSHERELDLAQLGTGLARLFGNLGNDRNFSGCRFLVEPGRFLTGEAGLYVAAVTDIKISRGKKFLITNGGMHHHLAASGNLGQTIKRNYPIVLANKLHPEELETVDVVGPLCTPLDTLARGISLPKAEIGDLLAIFQSGAYGLTASPTRFLSHPPPTEIWIDSGVHRKISQ
jgi:diaminopimelate decarboxylase